MEITYGVEKTRLPLREYLLMLKEAGLNSIPGTAAEILDDKVRRSLSPNKLKVRQWIEVVRTAHSLGIPSTSTTECRFCCIHWEAATHFHGVTPTDISRRRRVMLHFVPPVVVSRAFCAGWGGPGYSNCFRNAASCCFKSATSF
jgi:hypothetical protein